MYNDRDLEKRLDITEDALVDIKDIQEKIEAIKIDKKYDGNEKARKEAIKAERKKQEEIRNNAINKAYGN